MNDNHFKPLGGNCWVRMGDDTLYSEQEMKHTLLIEKQRNVLAKTRRKQDRARNTYLRLVADTNEAEADLLDLQIEYDDMGVR